MVDICIDLLNTLVLNWLSFQIQNNFSKYFHWIWSNSITGQENLSLWNYQCIDSPNWKIWIHFPTNTDLYIIIFDPSSRTLSWRRFVLFLNIHVICLLLNWCYPCCQSHSYLHVISKSISSHKSSCLMKSTVLLTWSN